ncbi:hypothetical protein [Hyphomicrobium sp. MC8b]|uniref:hypothetical protein n=1 Tax=Hyphomicrobium sp. MC8b TaxID=300273 RepID=UPI00391D5CBC
MNKDDQFNNLNGQQPMIRIPETVQPVQYTKLDIVLEHIYASIQMISTECNSFSVHVVTMACRELLLNLAHQKGIELEWDHRRFVKPQFWNQYRQKSVLAYNYFKHADRDPDALYNGPSYGNLAHLNDAQTLFNISGYHSLGRKPTGPMAHFSVAMMLLYPQYFKMDFLDEYPEHKRQYQSVPKERSVVLSALRSSLLASKYLPRIPEFD